MALDRQSIEKKDFPVGRRGYDPEAVDVHLSALADEIADFKRSARRRSDTLASSASDQVRAIVEAAENSAADIQREAETEAREIREEASNEAQATREQASDQAREYVSKVSESSAAMLSRIDAMESELGALVDSLRTAGNRLDADLRLLESNLTDLGEAVAPQRQFEPEPEAEPEPLPAPQPAFAEHDELAHEDEPPPEEFGSDPLGEQALAQAESHSGGTDDSEGARLIALNMALNGTPREETAKYLAENFSLADSAGLLDDVYASSVED